MDSFSALALLGKNETIDVVESPLVAIWLREKAKRDPIAFCRLADDNTERFQRILGKPEKSRNGQGTTWVWGVEEQGVPLLVLSSARGSQYMIHYPGGLRAFGADRKMGSAITKFLERLILDLSGFGDGLRDR